MVKYSFPSPLQQLPVTPVHVLSTSVMVGWLCGTHTWKEWLFCRRQQGSSHSSGSPCPLAAFLEILCVKKQNAVCKQTNLCLDEEKDRDFLIFISTRCC